MLYCKDRDGNLRKIAYGTYDENIEFISDQGIARRMLFRSGVETYGAILVRVK